MEIRVESTQFSPNHGGGGGGFYQGRSDQAPVPSASEDDEETIADPLGTDSCQLSGSHPSVLQLDCIPVARIPDEPLPPSDPQAELIKLNNEIQSTLRLMQLRMIRLEKNMERRLGQQIGDIFIG